MPPITCSFQAPEHISDPEIERFGRFQLFPGERHRHRRTRHAPGRVSNIEGLAPHIHVVVDENLPGALDRLPLHGDLPGVILHDVPPHHFCDLARTIEADMRGVDGDKKAHSKRVGQLIAERAKAAGIESVVFDRGGYTYGGRLAALADAARESGLKF